MATLAGRAETRAGENTYNFNDHPGLLLAVSAVNSGAARIECTVAARVKHTPPGLPVGATVTTKLGAFTIGEPSKHESIDSVILRAKKTKYSR